jgi:hypothetical protein
MLERIKKHEGIDIAIAAASAVFGLLISPIFDAITTPLVDPLVRAVLSAISLFSILIIISIIVIGVFAKRQEKDVAKVDEELSSINRRLGLSVRFVQSPPNHSTGEVYRISREIIEKAEKEILHFYYIRPQGTSEPTPQHSIETETYQRERAKYTQAILDVVRKHKNNKFFYRKIFQFPEGRNASFTEERVGKRWYEHTKTMLEVLTDYPDVAVIKKAPLFLQQNFFIVDERYIIWGIDAIDPEYDVPYYEGTLFFDDPHQEFIRYLKNYFLRVDAHATIIQKLPE